MKPVSKDDLAELLSQLDAETRERWADLLESVDAEIQEKGPAALREHLDAALRHLLLEAQFGLDVPQELRAALGEAVGAKVTFRLDVAEPNQPVRIATD